MNPNQQVHWLCLTCGKKHGFIVRPNASWHFATCQRCHIKDAVVDQQKAA